MPPADAPDELIPMPAAARIAFEAMESTVTGMMARRAGNAPDGPLCFMAQKLIDAGAVLHGKRHPSTWTYPVPEDAWFDQRFKQDAGVLAGQDGRVTFTDLAIRRRDLDAAIADLKEAYRER